MNGRMKEALEVCMGRLERGLSVDEALSGYESLEQELRPLLEAAAELRAASANASDYPPAAQAAGRARMHATREEVAGRRHSLFTAVPWRPLTALGLGAVALAIVALTTNVFDFRGSTTVARADGVVSRSSTDTVILATSQGPLTVQIKEDTVVLDSSGNAISGGQIVPGAPATVEFEEDGDEVSGVKIEIEEDDDDDGNESHGAEVEFEGVLQSVSGNVLVLSTGFGIATVYTDAGTQIEGALQPGQLLEIHAVVQADGSYLAREIKAGESEAEGDASAPGGNVGPSQTEAPGGDEPDEHPQEEPQEPED